MAETQEILDALVDRLAPGRLEEIQEERERSEAQAAEQERVRKIMDAFNRPVTTELEMTRRKEAGVERQRQRSLLERELFEFSKQELIEQGVDVETGGPIGPRAEISLTPVERQEFVLNSTFGDGNWRHTDLGVVVSLDTENGPQEVLLDEAGFSLKDFADMAGAGPEVAAAMGAAIGTAVAFPGLATGGTLSLLGYAVLVAASGQIAGGASDLAFSLKNGGLDMDRKEDRDLILNIAKRRGVNAAIDTVLDFATAGGARLAISPMGRRMITSPQKEILEASGRQGVPLSIGEKTGSPLMMRAEALTEKVPGAIGPAMRLREKTTNVMRGQIGEVTEGAPSAEDVGRAFSDNLTNQMNRRVEEIERLDKEAGRLIDVRISELEKRLASRSLSSSESGEMVRRTIKRERLKFKGRQSIIEDHAESLINDLPPDQRAFVPTADVKSTALQLKTQFPRDKKGKIIDEFLPAELKKFFAGVDKLPDKMTVKELRNLRTILANAIDDSAALPGVGQGVLKQMEAATTRALKGAIDEAPTDDIRYFLGQALEHYRVNNRKFRTAAVAKTFRTEERMGFVENEDILPGLMKKNRVEDVRRILNVIGTDSIAAKVSRRSVFQDMITAGQNSLLSKGNVDAKRFAREFDKLSPDMQKIIFGEDVNEVGRIIKLIASRGGDFDLSNVAASRGTESIRLLLRSAAAKELSLRADFDRKIIKPIIQGELPVTQLAPEDFVRHVLKTGSLDDVRTLFRLAPPNLQDAFRKRSIIQVLEMAEQTAGEATDKIIAFSRKAGNPSEKLLDVMRKGFGPDSQTSIAKMKMVLGDDGFELLKDMGVIAAARARKTSAAKAVGGLVGGSILSKLLTFQISAGLQVAQYRLVSTLMRAPVTRQWLSNDLIFKGKSFGQSLAIVTPQITRAITQEFGEDSETAAKMNAWVRGEISIPIPGIGDATFREFLESEREGIR